MDLDSIKSHLKEMFPSVENDKLDHLLRTNSDINIIITKLLDKDHEGFEIDLKEVNFKKNDFIKLKPQYNIKPDLYYPEVWANKTIYGNINIGKCREEARMIYEQIKRLNSKETSNRLSAVSSYVVEETERLREKAVKLDEKAAIFIMKKCLENMTVLRKNVGERRMGEYKMGMSRSGGSSGTHNFILDLHGLFVKEALKFVSDYLVVYKPHSFTLITGSVETGKFLRPSLTTFLRDKKYTVKQTQSGLEIKK